MSADDSVRKSGAALSGVARHFYDLKVECD